MLVGAIPKLLPPPPQTGVNLERKRWKVILHTSDTFSCLARGWNLLTDPLTSWVCSSSGRCYHDYLPANAHHDWSCMLFSRTQAVVIYCFPIGRSDLHKPWDDLGTTGLERLDAQSLQSSCLSLVEGKLQALLHDDFISKEVSPYVIDGGVTKPNRLESDEIPPPEFIKVHQTAQLSCVGGVHDATPYFQSDPGICICRSATGHRHIAHNIAGRA